MNLWIRLTFDKDSEVELFDLVDKVDGPSFRWKWLEGRVIEQEIGWIFIVMRRVLSNKGVK